MGDKLINREGEVHQMKSGQKLKILKYLNYHNIDVIFEDGVVLKNVEYSQILKKTLKNLNTPSVCKVGYLGYGEYKTKEEGMPTKAYTVWQHLIVRCYDEKELEKHPTYKDVLVCDEWKCFQNFAKWFYNNYIDGFQLDKDILIKGNKIYSPDTCCFVPHEINTLFVNQDRNRGDYPIGVTFSKNNKSFVYQLNKFKKRQVKYFKTEEEAFQAYKIAKESYIKEIAEKYKDKIKPQVYNALINYKVEITD